MTAAAAHGLRKAPTIFISAGEASGYLHDADEVAVVLPFEEAFLRRAGVHARFVGHPLLDLPAGGQTHEEWARAQGLDPARPVLALFPGSRAQEVRRHLALFADTAARVV